MTQRPASLDDFPSTVLRCAFMSLCYMYKGCIHYVLTLQPHAAWIGFFLRGWVVVQYVMSCVIHIV
jgi:hypothetical protein